MNVLKEGGGGSSFWIVPVLFDGRRRRRCTTPDEVCSCVGRVVNVVDSIGLEEVFYGGKGSW